MTAPIYDRSVTVATTHISNTPHRKAGREAEIILETPDSLIELLLKRNKIPQAVHGEHPLTLDQWLHRRCLNKDRNISGSLDWHLSREKRVYIWKNLKRSQSYLGTLCLLPTCSQQSCTLESKPIPQKCIPQEAGPQTDKSLHSISKLFLNILLLKKLETLLSSLLFKSRTHLRCLQDSQLPLPSLHSACHRLLMTGP